MTCDNKNATIYSTTNKLPCYPSFTALWISPRPTRTNPNNGVLPPESETHVKTMPDRISYLTWPKNKALLNWNLLFIMSVWDAFYFEFFGKRWQSGLPWFVSSIHIYDKPCARLNAIVAYKREILFQVPSLKMKIKLAESMQWAGNVGPHIIGSTFCYPINVTQIALTKPFTKF